MKHVVRGVGLLEDGGVIVEFVTPSDDVGANGVIINHSLLIPPTDEFEDELDAAVTAIQLLLVTALASLAAAGPVDLPDAVEDEGPSPYDHPADGGRA